MTSRIDDLLDTIDAGLQSTTETSYGSDHEGLCVRDDCYREAADESDFCDPCREYMLGDRHDDPAGRVLGAEPDTSSDHLLAMRLASEGHWDIRAELLEHLGISSAQRVGPMAELIGELATAELLYGQGAAETLAGTVGFQTRLTSARMRSLYEEAMRNLATPPPS